MNSLSIQSISLIVVGIINLALGAIIYSKEKQNKSNILFALVAISVSFWVLTRALFEIFPIDGIIYIVGNFLYISASLIPLFFVLFTYTFPSDTISLTKRRVLLVTIPNIIIIFSILIPGFIINDVTYDPRGYKAITFGIGYKYYAFYVIGYFFLGFINLIKKYIKSSGIAKIQLRYIFLGTFIATSIGITTNLILPNFGSFRFFWLGPVMTVAMVVFIAYAIVKHHLLDIKIISTEIFSFALVFVLFLQIFFSDTFAIRLISIGVFLGAAGFGILLVRSVIKEVKNREELEHLTQELSNANEELKKLDKAKSEFISIASHQLRTPLSIIKGYISMIQEGSFGRMTKKLAEPLRRVYLSNERLIKLVNDLLDLSRMEGGRMRYDMKQGRLSIIIASVIEEFQQIAQSKGLVLHFKKENNDPLVRFDEEKMRQVVFNLIDNAVRYTPKGGGITITLTINPYHLLFSVADTGIGLEKQEINGLFQKFVRSREVARIHTEGVGLGLYVARRIVEDHGGRIWAESAGKGKGSAFFVELPIKKIAV